MVLPRLESVRQAATHHHAWVRTMEGISEETRWVNYDDLADARGISRESAIRMARRKRWPRKKLNDGGVMVAAPVTALVREER
ncbi:MAG: hypothetical protein JO212_02105, partial [Acetobacteraceae bacterium]|nr:hypothetical protein [Acetobacteraceae bacterium]